ncbi:hypothetical protein H0I31_00130 [Tenacibaculum sp. AHE15PA]|uniref:hypothetical protein n=1 Tax=unclassified Tenacibaculum TaxID=2635139 RepID=UPI001C4EAC92|nr:MULTISPECIES: hypothetical protein [unclassified Tenacibaculum]QXP74562.1 hypothetical protein H0I30_05390 [Tenacibaculum sp. AHE14PA]QXP76073.1 hypothetical protein H0I31_00130 [Tenacibaculum sp. AHE15PA]
MKKKVIALLGLLICIIGATIYFLEYNNPILPFFLKGTSLFIMLLGSSVAFFYSLFDKKIKQ